MKVNLQADNKKITARAKAQVSGPDVSGVLILLNMMLVAGNMSTFDLN